MCHAHYQRTRNHGDPLAGRTPDGEPQRFIQEVALQHTGDECLTWPFSKVGAGYGRLWVDGKHVIASRYICELTHGAPPTPEHQSAHSCGKGNEGCISPTHLSWKTPADNESDKLIHGTHSRGERCGTAKLTEPQAREILALKGVEPQIKLAERFRVSRSTVGEIHAGRNWAWLSEEVSA